MTDRVKRFLWQLLFVLLTGGLGGLFALKAGELPQTHELPPLYPPAWLFPVIWSILYILMAYAASLIDPKPPEARRPMLMYYISLGLNFLCPVLFYRLHAHIPAAVVCVLLLGVVLLLIRAFGPLNEKAAKLLYPYAVWMAFVTYLSIGVAALNNV